MGKLTTGSGDSYQGEFKNNKYHGKGQLKYGATDKNATQDIYDGFFREGLRHDFGLLITDNQMTQYNGEWQFDRRHGKGQLIIVNPESKNQREIDGEWVNDEFQFDKVVKVVIKDANWKTISSIECKVDKDYNPIV